MCSLQGRLYFQGFTILFRTTFASSTNTCKILCHLFYHACIRMHVTIIITCTFSSQNVTGIMPTQQKKMYLPVCLFSFLSLPLTLIHAFTLSFSHSLGKTSVLFSLSSHLLLISTLVFPLSFVPSVAVQVLWRSRV